MAGYIQPSIIKTFYPHENKPARKVSKWFGNHSGETIERNARSQQVFSLTTSEAVDPTDLGLQ